MLESFGSLLGMAFSSSSTSALNEAKELGVKEGNMKGDGLRLGGILIVKETGSDILMLRRQNKVNKR